MVQGWDQLRLGARWRTGVAGASSCPFPSSWLSSLGPEPQWLLDRHEGSGREMRRRKLIG